MTYWDLASFIAMSLTGMFVMSFGSFGTWLLCTFMSVTRWLMALPLGIGIIILYASIVLFWKAAL